MSISEGAQAPAFSLPASRGRTISSAGLRGRAYVLYFYPKADTSGCTKEAQQFQGAVQEFARYGCDVIGVSRDSIKTIDKFASKYSLQFPLASDEQGDLSTAYGVWVEKSMYGRKYMGIERSTYFVGKDGRVRGVWQKVKVDGHADEVLAAVANAA